MMRTIFVIGVMISIMLGAFTPVLPFAGPSLAMAQSCKARENPQETADSFIARCRKASIGRVFPTHLLHTKLGDIRKGKLWDYKTAWKLLNDRRFEK
ncbi:hypothetical protein [Sorangium sp. So ce1099]|uniref:hypothetical protein n=1 Tax=Sorangium sp. So ce1099 TaxID=3133331 RepID=UPI003F61C60C